MKSNSINTPGVVAAAGDATNIFEIMAIIAYYQDQAVRARKLAQEGSIVPFKAAPSGDFDAGIGFEHKAAEWQKILESIADAKREALGMKPAGIIDTKVMDSKGNKVSAPKEGEEERTETSTEIEDEKGDEGMADTLRELANDDKARREILTLWNMKNPGVYIMDINDDKKFAEVTEKDKENKFFVVENRHVNGKEIAVKRTLHTKEHAVLMYREFMEKKGIDISKMSTPEIKIEITALASEEARQQKINTRKSIEEKLEDLGILTVRESVNTFTGAELIERAGKFIEGDEFNMLILAGTDDSANLSAADQVKMKAIQLTAVGAKTEAVSLIYTYYKEKDGMTRQLAESFVHKLMRQNPYQELIMALRKIFEYYQEKDKNYAKGIPSAKNLINSYTRRQAIDAKGELVFEETGTGKKKDRVPVFETWPENKVNNFIDKVLADLADEGSIVLPAKLEKPKSDKKKSEEGEKSDTENEEVSQEGKEKTTDTPAAEPEKPAEETPAEDKKPDAGSPAEEDAGTEESGTEGTSEPTKEKKVDTPAEPVLELVVTSNAQNTVFTASAEGTQFKHTSKKVGEAFQKECASKFKKFFTNAQKHNAKCEKNKSLTPMALPKGFESGWKIGDKFTLKLYVEKPEDKK